MRTLPLIVTSAMLVCMTAAGCRREAPGTGDTTERVTVPAQGEPGVPAPAASTATAPGGALQLVTAGAPQPYLGDSAGQALYFVEGDTDGSKCTGDCIRAWPPFLADQATPTGGANLQADRIGTITRADGSRQVTYNGHPLYHYAADTGADRAAGNGVKDQWGQWHAIDAAGEPLPMSAPQPAQQATQPGQQPATEQPTQPPQR